MEALKRANAIICSIEEDIIAELSKSIRMTLIYRLFNNILKHD